MRRLLSYVKPTHCTLNCALASAATNSTMAAPRVTSGRLRFPALLMTPPFFSCPRPGKNRPPEAPRPLTSQSRTTRVRRGSALLHGEQLQADGRRRVDPGQVLVALGAAVREQVHGLELDRVRDRPLLRLEQLA